ncbi:MAG TPA: TrmH family RNA methyltransferase [Nitriliruptorales bacterium]|jgi:TrmH family RNA methyltransferase
MTMAVPPGDLVAAFGAVHGNASLVLLEGLHPWKHAHRFGAIVLLAATHDRRRLQRLVDRLAPDLSLETVQDVDETVWQQLAPRDTTSPLLAVAERREWSLDDVRSNGHVVVLDRPRHAGNVGAAIRAAAAANAAGVVTLGGVDPWTPAAVRGAAGLQFALPVVPLPEGSPVPDLGRPTVALDPEGAPLVAATTTATTWVFGTERDGLDERLLAACDAVASLPMRDGVSSLNLAVSVGVVLYLQETDG